MLGKVKWDYVVCDEGHKLKNPNIQTSRGLRMIGTSHRLLLTGTPLQNNLEELRALYDFAAPGLLPAQDEFKRYYARPITDGADRDASEAEQLLGELRARELRDKIRP
jgi:SNF2 family DNA or RNA helicase